MTRRGYTLVELVLVMFLLIMVAFFVFAVTGAGSQTYLRLQDRQERISDLRTGLSYIDVKIRSHDRTGSLAVETEPIGGSPAVTIRQDIDGAFYTTWIFVYDGYLCELFISTDIPFDPALASRIVRVDGMTIARSGASAITVTLERQDGPDRQIRSRTVGLRSGEVIG